MIDAKAAVMIGSALAGAIAFWAAVYGWGKWLNRPRTLDRLDAPAQDMRLERMEQILEAIALEVERLGEGQRYTTRLLAERERLSHGVLPPTVAPARSITPH